MSDQEEKEEEQEGKVTVEVVTREAVRDQFGQLMREYIAESGIKKLEQKLDNHVKQFNAAMAQVQKEIKNGTLQANNVSKSILDLGAFQEGIQRRWNEFVENHDKISAYMQQAESKLKALDLRSKDLWEPLEQNAKKIESLAYKYNSVDTDIKTLEDRSQVLAEQGNAINAKISKLTQAFADKITIKKSKHIDSEV